MAERCGRFGHLLCAAAALSLIAALVHLWVVPEHFEEWWGYGTFFLVVAAAQALYGMALLWRPGDGLFALGITVNLALLILYMVTRTVGIPVFGPHAGHVEELETAGLLTKTAELVLVALLLAAWYRGRTVEQSGGLPESLK